SYYDGTSSSASRQAVNGTYRTVNLLEIIVYELDTTGEFAGYIQNVMSDFSYYDGTSSSAPQQQVNGHYRTVELLEIIAYELDY
ncbi:MAG: hypothetical protein MJ099_04480, partial [Clostridia bacterium]|nr:hypothetical protein [Clostridia bacterium]